MNVEKRIKNLEKLVEELIIENEKLVDRIDDLEDDHINLLLKDCLCNADGGDNLSCESLIHYCICHKLQKRSYDCRAKTYDVSGHNCICPYEVKDGTEIINRVKWCRGHQDSLIKDVKEVNEVGNVQINKKLKFNGRTFIRQFLARLKK